jgi:heme oxygenase
MATPLRFAPQAQMFLLRATGRLHKRLDQDSVLASLVRPGVTWGQYLAAMKALERSYRPIDASLLQGAALCPDGLPPYLPRGATLRRDLLVLNEFPDVPWISHQTALAVLDSSSAYLGMRYVVEGAQFGSRMIHRALYKTFGGTFEAAGSFWSPDAPWQGSWPSVASGLSQLESRQSLASAARAARQSFRHFVEQLCAPVDELGAKAC